MKDAGLANSWILLAGFHDGMQIAAGDHDDWYWNAFTWRTGSSKSKHYIPDTDHPANLGIWIAWVADQLKCPVLKVAAETWAYAGDYPPSHALLLAYANKRPDDLPDTVRDWLDSSG